MDENEHPRKRYKTYIGDPKKKVPKSTKHYRHIKNVLGPLQLHNDVHSQIESNGKCESGNNSGNQSLNSPENQLIDDCANQFVNLDPKEKTAERDCSIRSGSEVSSANLLHNIESSDEANKSEESNSSIESFNEVSKSDECNNYEENNIFDKLTNDNEDDMNNVNMLESEDDLTNNEEDISEASEDNDLNRSLLYDNSLLSRQESELLIMATALRHHLPDNGLDSMLMLIDCHINESIFKSKHKFLKAFPDYNMINYFYCCSRILKFQENNACECKKCKKQLFKPQLIDAQKFFIYIPLQQQLVDLMNSTVYERLRKETDESDVVNGDKYKFLREKDIIQNHDISLQWNVDGVNLCKSSKKSMWTIQVTLNELPYRDRKKNVMLCGLWYADKKPPMNLFLKPFVQELIELSEKGFMCSTFLSKTEINIKVHTIFCSVDSVARPLVQNMKQYNGKYGCSFCLHKGQQIGIGRGTTRVYPWGLKCNRTNSEHIDHIQYALTLNKDFKGVKGPSVVSLLPGTDIINDFPPDYMHSCLLGVGKLFAKTWFDSKNRQKRYYLGLRKEEFNEKLLCIKPPCEITRIPKPIDDKYNANEWKNFILYYSIPCLDGLLDRKYFKHWYLFVFTLYQFSKSKISDEDFNLGRDALYQFVKETQTLYGKQMMKFNVHLLIHIPKFIKLYGALWAWSAFPYENFNGVIKQLFYGTQYIPQQICKAYNRLRYVKNNSYIFGNPACNKKAVALFTKLMNECRVKNCIEYNESLVVFGRPRLLELTLVQKMIIEQTLGEIIENNCTSYHRFIYNNILYHTANYRRLKKRHNSTILTSDNKIMNIINLLEVTCTTTRKNKYFVMGNKYLVLDDILCQNRNFCLKNVFIAKESTFIMCCQIENIKSKCVSISYNFTKKCIIPIVNIFETD